MTVQKARAGIFSNAVWVVSARLIVRFLGTISTIVLARILVPEDFGLIAVMLGLTGIISGLSQFGFNHALIQFKNTSNEDYATAWTMNICRGIVLSIIVFLLSFPAAEYLNDGRYLAMLQVVACLPFIKALENIKFIEFDKNLEFNVVFKVMVITKVLGVITTISLAILWRNYWVLIAGMIVTAITRVTLTYYYAPLITQFTFQSWRKLFNFSGWLFGAQALSTLSVRLEPLILTVIFSPAIVGVVHVAKEISQLTNEIAAPMRRVLFPTLSKFEPNTPEFVDTYKKSVAGLFMIMAPACFGLALISSILVPLLLGEKWLQTIPYIQLLSTLAGITVIGRTAQSAVMATGDTKLYFYRALIYLPIRLSLVTLGSIYYGEVGLMIAFTCFEIIVLFLNVSMAKKSTGQSFVAHVIIVLRFIPSLVAMCLVVILLNLFLNGRDIGTFISIMSLLFTVISGILMYSLSLYLIWTISRRPDGPEKTIITAVSKKLPICARLL
jgi:PST family polysaccharide transporter